MAMYSMYPQSSSQMLYQDSQRRQQALQSQMGYYSDAHSSHQSQGLGLTDASSYVRPYTTAYDHMGLSYPMNQGSYATGLAITDGLPHGYPYSRLLQSGLLPGMPDEADTASRPRLTAEQTRELEALYAANHKPSTQQKQEYAQRFRLTKNRVDNWFQNRRAKSKHQNKAKQSELAVAKADSSSKSESSSSHPYNTTLSSQNTTIDLLSSTFGNNQDLASQEDHMPTQTEPSRQQSTDQSHTSESTSQNVFGSEPCASPSQASLKSFDYASGNYQSQPHLAAEYPPEAFTRRGSALADLTSHMNGISIPFDHTSQDLFPTDHRGFGERRAQRPAALSTMRSISSGGSLRSPLTTETTVPRSLRRINTCGTPLNKTGRIQKYSAVTPSRSPGTLSQALNRAMGSMTPQVYSSASPEHVSAKDEHSNEDIIDSGVVFALNPPSTDVTWTEHNTNDYPVPPLSASLTGEDGSPPITPLTGQADFPHAWTTNEAISTTSTNSVPTFPDPSPLLMQEATHLVPHGSNQQQQHQQSLSQFWDGSNAELFGIPFDFDTASVSGSDSRNGSLGSLSMSGHIGYGYSSLAARRGRNDPLKIEFSHPYQDAQPHYLLPVRGNQNFTFHEYNPDHARRSEGL